MNKEEILAKSRNENKGMDEREQQVLANGGRIAFHIGAVVCTLIVLLDAVLWIIDDSLHDFKLVLCSWSIYMLMTGVLFLYKYVKLRRVHELVNAVVQLAAGLTLLTILVLRMTGVV